MFGQSRAEKLFRRIVVTIFYLSIPLIVIAAGVAVWHVVTTISETTEAKRDAMPPVEIRRPADTSRTGS